MGFNSAAALPACLFIPARNIGAVLPYTIPENTSVILPGTAQALDFSGFNTLSVFVTVTGIPAGNRLIVALQTFDPETGLSLPGSLGSVDLITQTADGTYAATLYLPAYYATLSAKILPFFQNVVNVINDGMNVGTLSITALKFWLSNA